MPAWFPILLISHIVLAISLLLPSLLLPFALRTRRAASDSDNRVVRGLLRLQGGGTLVLGLGVALTGVGLVLTLGYQIVAQTWLLVALVIYALDLLLAFFIQRPNLRRLIGIRAAWDDEVWRARARRQRYVSYAMAGLVGAIGFLMSTKPVLW
ncbi:MAG: hypothetical protein ACRDGQ_06040 [Candidatus Limnocylindrales bacterium]